MAEVQMTTDIHALWQQTVTSAVMGSERSQLSPLKADGCLGDVLAGAARIDGEAGILASAAAIYLFKTAGHVPEQVADGLVQPCEAEDLPRCGPAAARFFMNMFAGTHSSLIPQWLSAVADAGKVASPDIVPEILALSKKSPELMEIVLKVTGKRGIWIIAQGPQWSNLEGNEEEVWQTGEKKSRMTALMFVREKDPDKARKMLASTWNDETPEDKAGYLALLLMHLSMADEQFLEEALDDKRKEVRAAAAELLARLPESRFNKRTLERLRPLLVFSEGQRAKLIIGGRKSSLAVTLPEKITKDMERDGVQKKPPHGTGEKAWWLIQMLGFVPPSYWCKEWNVTPSQLIEAVDRSEWKEAITQGWIEAAKRHLDVDWAESLLTGSNAGIVKSEKSALAKVLPKERLEAIVTSMLPSNDGIDLLYLCTHAWNDELGRAALDAFCKRILGAKHADWQKHQICRFFGEYMTPSLYDETVSRLDKIIQTDSPWKSAVDNFLSILQYRHDMIRAISGDDR